MRMTRELVLTIYSNLFGTGKRTAHQIVQKRMACYTNQDWRLET